MDFRNEWKTTISRSDVMTLDHRLSAVTRQDLHAGAGHYVVHTLYFDDVEDLPLRSDGSQARNSMEYRIRYYNDNLNLIKLEKKYASNGTSVIEACEVTREFVENIIRKNFSAIVKDPMGRTGDDLDPLIQEFYWKVIGNGMSPRAAVDYYRKPYIYPYGDVRVTIDYNFRKTNDISVFLNPLMMERVAGDGRYFLKVTWNNYLPEVIKSAVTLINRKNPTYFLYEPAEMIV